MQVARLSISIRNTIRHRAIVAAFKPREDAVNAEIAAHGVALYERVFPKKVRALLAAVPKDFLRVTTTVGFNVNGYQFVFPLLEAVPFPRRPCDQSPLGSFDDAELRDAILATFNKRDDLKAERKTADSALAAFLHSFTTLRALHEAWPEGEPHYADLLLIAPSRLPALQSVEINRLLGFGIAA